MKKFKIIIVISLLTLSNHVFAAEFGHFIGTVKTAWGSEREMLLLENFSYVDIQGNKWTAPKNWIIDGSTIPPIFWGYLIGSPYIGNHRKASVIHDYYCDEKNPNRHLKQWKDVHRIYYYASRAAGVGSIESKLMYWAVYLGGPRWESAAKSCYNGCHISDGIESLAHHPVFDAEKVLEVRKWTEESNPDISEIESRLDVLTSDPPTHGSKENIKKSHQQLKFLMEEKLDKK